MRYPHVKPSEQTIELWLEYYEDKDTDIADALKELLDLRAELQRRREADKYGPMEG